MALERLLYGHPGLKAAADFSDAAVHQFTAKLVDSNGKAATATAGGAMSGVLQNSPKADEGCVLESLAMSKALTVAAVTAGAQAAVGAGGKFKDAVAGEVIVGRFKDAATAADQLVTLLIGNEGIKA